MIFQLNLTILSPLPFHHHQGVFLLFLVCIVDKQNYLVLTYTLGMNLEEGATAMARNDQIGGHKA